MKKSVLILFIIFANHFSAAAEETIKLYVTYGQRVTSIEKYVSAEDLRGALIAAERINSNGGILGRRLEIIDGRAVNPTECKEKALEQIRKNEITAVVGANTSNLSKLIAPLFHKAEIPMVSPISTHPDVSRVGDYIFRTCFTDPFQGKLMASYALNGLSAKTAAVLTKATSTFSMSISEYFIKEFETKGEIILQDFYDPQGSNFSEMLEKVKISNPDIVFIPGHGSDSGLILKQAHSMGINSVFMGGDGWGKGLLGVAGENAAEGNYFVNHWHQKIDTVQNRDFVKRYFDKYGKGNIAASAALSYDSVNIIVNAIIKAGSTDRKSLRKAISETRNFIGITGKITFDKQGDPVNKSGVIMKYEKGEIVFVKSVQP